MRLKRWISLSFIFVSVVICSALFTISTRAENAYSDQWIKNGSAINYTSSTNPLMGYGIYNQGQNNEKDPWYSILANVPKGVSVFYSNAEAFNSRPYQGTVIIFTDDPSGVYSVFNRTNEPADPTFTDITWSKNNPFVHQADFNSLFSFTYDYYCVSFTVSSDYRINNCMYSVDNWQQLYDMLQTDNWNPDASVNGYPEDNLPFLSYTLKRSLVPRLGITDGNGLAQIKETFLWDYTEKNPYRDFPEGYTFDIMAYANFKTVNGFEGFDRDNLEINDANKVYVSYGGYNISINEYSFLYGDIGKSVYNRGGKVWKDDSENSIAQGYILGIRTRTYDSSKTSWWKLYICQAGGYVFSTNKCIDDEGNVRDAPTNAENSDDGIGVGTGGLPNYSTDNNSSAAQDSTGDIYSGTDVAGQMSLSAVINNLKEIVNGMGQITHIVEMLFLQVPGWLITLMWTSLGLLIAIGVAKHIIG